MKILFLTPQLPYPPQKGTAMRNWGLIAGLAERHQVAVLSFLDPGQSPELSDALTGACRVQVVAPPARTNRDRLRDLLTTSRPDMALRLASPTYAAALAAWLERESFDVVHVEGIELAPYLDVLQAVFGRLRPGSDGARGTLQGSFVPEAVHTEGGLGGTGTCSPAVASPQLDGGCGACPERSRRGQEPPADAGRGASRAVSRRPLIVFDDHNCEYLLQKRVFLTDLRIPRRWPGAAYSFAQWRRLRRYEAAVCRRADRVLAVSQADAVALRQLVPGLAVSVVPNGIDTRAYRPQPAGANTRGPGTGRALVFTGTMDFRPNVDAALWFAREVLPRVRVAAPPVRFVVVGQRPHRRLDVLRGEPGVTLTGWVEDPRPYIADAAVYVVPLRMGGGTRFKILEALAMGKAVVSTTLGAEGFPVAHERELLLADEPGAFAAAVVALLGDPERRAALGAAGRAFVEAQYDWRAIVPLVEQAWG